MTTTRRLSILLFLVTAAALALAQSARTLRVKIEAPKYDRVMLLERLNDNGRSKGLRFTEADSEYDYRIVFNTEQTQAIEVSAGSGGTNNRSAAKTSVYDAKDEALFEFRRDKRLTDKGATNAVAKEIIKRLLVLGAK